MLSKQDVLRVAAEAGLDPRTVGRIVNEGIAPRSEATRQSLVKALEVLGFDDAAETLKGEVR